IGAVGGEEDGHSAEINDKLYSTPAQGIAVAQRLGLGERGRYMAAFTFGNVHGAYKPGVVKLRPELLDEIQTTVALAIKAGEMPDPAHSLDVALGKPFALVFHGGSGSAPEEIAQAVSYGVVKMNIDTDTQYAF
ncbi:class II fructose-bisphosphate aldolase, partial [Algiphilus sp. NNCM1]|nr:class II fructose-bisphosphate aldolase [Algiphilus acroporae]